jgi:phage-related minor tail protein
VPKEAPIAADVDFAGLGRDYVLTGGQIVNAVLAALAAAAARIAESGVEPVVAMSDFTTAAGRERDSNPATKLKSIGF